MKRASSAYTIGRRMFAKISAVEGIRLTKEMKKDFKAFDRKSLSNKARRSTIAKKYAVR